MKRGDLLSLGAVVALLFVLILTRTADVKAQSPSPAPSIVLHNFGVIPRATATPAEHHAIENDEPEKPLPRSWLIGGAIAVVIGLAGLIYGATRVWHSSNLFDRQYRFPPPQDVPLRLGGEKSGGHMATLRFRAPKASEAKDV